MTSPLWGTFFSTSLEMSATVASVDPVDRVEFVMDGLVVHTDESAPYAVSWTPPPTLAFAYHWLLVRAYDIDGDADQSPGVMVTYWR